jgi:hypothetical protein
MKSLLTILVFVYLPLLYVCTKNIAGTETTNGDQIIITTKADYIEGIAPSGSEVRIYAENFYPYNDSGFKMNSIVNDSGEFRFDTLKPGNYNLYCKSGMRDSAIFVQKIQVALSNIADTDTVTLTKSGAVKGTLIDTLSKPVVSAYAFIKGSPFFVLTNAEGTYSFSNIPQGTYSISFIDVNRNGHPIKGGTSISVDVTAGRATELEPFVYK